MEKSIVTDHIGEEVTINGLNNLLLNEKLRMYVRKPGFKIKEFTDEEGLIVLINDEGVELIVPSENVEVVR